MQKVGYAIVVGGWLLIIYAIRESSILINENDLVFPFYLMNFPWTNLIFLFFIPYSAFQLKQSERQSSLFYQCYQLLKLLLQTALGGMANLILIFVVIKLVKQDFLPGYSLSGYKEWIVIILCMLWWPFAWYSFQSWKKQKLKESHIINSIWTTSGMFLLMETFRSFENFGRYSYFERFPSEFLTLLGFFLILVGGIIMERSALSRQQTPQGKTVASIPDT